MRMRSTSWLSLLLLAGAGCGGAPDPGPSEPGEGEPSVLEIPALSPLGLAALAALLVGLGVGVLRRRTA